MLAVMIDRPAPVAPAVSASPEGEAAPKAAAGAVRATVDAAAQLVRRATSGDRLALEQLLRAHAGNVAAVCHHLAGSDARDATQESLEKVVRELSAFDASKGSFKSWSAMVARNVCRDRLRRRGLERQAFAADGDEIAGRAEGGIDPERHAIARQSAATLARALEGLPGPMREAIVMFHLGDASYEEIARALDVPMGTVMTWLHRGRQRLRAAIEEP